MTECLDFYIDGAWVAPSQKNLLPVLNPATEEPIGNISLGTKKDVDAAVAAAKRAFEDSEWSRMEHSMHAPSSSLSSCISTVLCVASTRMSAAGRTTWPRTSNTDPVATTDRTKHGGVLPR